MLYRWICFINGVPSGIPFFHTMGNFISYRMKTSGGSHCGGMEDVAYAPRRRRRIPQAGFLFTGKTEIELTAVRKKGIRERMKKGEIREGIVEAVKFPNKGCVRLLPVEEAPEAEEASDAKGEKTEYAMVKNVIPGQKLSVRITKVRKGKGEGRVLELLSPSPDEVKAPCPHFGSCGGCLYLSLPYEKQLALKEAQVKELLEAALAGQEKPWSFEPAKPSPRPYAYRNKMEFSFGDEMKDGPLSLGLHKRGGFYDIVAVTGCRIVDEDYRRILQGTLSYFREREISYFHRLSHVGYLRHLLVRKASITGELLIALVTTSQIDARKEEELLEGFADMLEALELEGKIAGILHIRNDSVADVVKSDETRILRGQDFFYEELLGLRFRISVFSFFQTNSYGAQVLYQTARDYIGDLGKKDCVVYDLYSGTGTIAQMMAPAAGKVIGVEIVEEAVEAARKNAKENGLSNCEFIAGDVLKVLDGISEKPDFIILDPPRDGIHPKALQKIIHYGVERMIYISCKPTSLARDLEVLTANGYRVERACCVDMFPWTANIETVVLLGRKFEKSREHVYLDYEPSAEIDLPGGATYSEIKQWIQAEYDLKVSSLYVAQVKQKHGIVERECYNKPKSENAKQPKCPPEKEAAIEAALKHFKMI